LLLRHGQGATNANTERYVERCPLASVCAFVGSTAVVRFVDDIRCAGTPSLGNSVVAVYCSCVSIALCVTYFACRMGECFALSSRTITKSNKPLASAIDCIADSSRTGSLPASSNGKFSGLATSCNPAATRPPLRRNAGPLNSRRDDAPRALAGELTCLGQEARGGSGSPLRSHKAVPPKKPQVIGVAASLLRYH
jgi:hypothetical protein